MVNLNATKLADIALALVNQTMADMMTMSCFCSPEIMREFDMVASKQDQSETYTRCLFREFQAYYVVLKCWLWGRDDAFCSKKHVCVGVASRFADSCKIIADGTMAKADGLLA